MGQREDVVQKQEQVEFQQPSTGQVEGGQEVPVEQGKNLNSITTYFEISAVSAKPVEDIEWSLQGIPVKVFLKVVF